MRGPLKAFPLPIFWSLAFLMCAPVCAAPPAAIPNPPAIPDSAIPDYGGRDSGPLAPSEAAPVAPNPAAQAGRAVEALVLVLVGIGGVVYALKRFGLVQPGADGKPARISLSGLSLLGLVRAAPNTDRAKASFVSVESSVPLPGGAMLHVVRAGGRTLLLAATVQSVTAVGEWPAEELPAEELPAEEVPAGTAFADYLSESETLTEVAAANARLRALLSRPPEETP